MILYFSGELMDMLKNDNNLTLEEIEELENKYLINYWYFLKFAQDEILEGFRTKNDIKKDWVGKYGNGEDGISNFAVGSERIIYSLLNGKITGQPNSCPVSSDLFFENSQAYVHIDLKSVTTNGGVTTHPETGKKLNDNINDFNTSIFIGENQNSYKCDIEIHKGRKTKELRPYNPQLPPVYSKSNGEYKICLTYFITILSNEVTFDTELISIMCVPNGRLYEHYKNRPLKAGKNPGKARFNFLEVNKFELLKDTPSRVKIVYKNPNMSEYIKEKLKSYPEFY